MSIVIKIPSWLYSFVVNNAVGLIMTGGIIGLAILLYAIGGK